MAGQRRLDLSYGHFTRISYDSRERSWNFSHDSQHVTQVQGFRECIASSLPLRDEASFINEHSGKRREAQLRWLSKSHPEAFPASAIIKEATESVRTPTVITEHEGCLLTIAIAKDIKRVSGTRRPTILAFASGAAGHILHLVRPRLQTRGWKDQNNGKLQLLDPSYLEHAYWTSPLGPIRQVAFASDGDTSPKSGVWLAVRQDTVITIFEPVYGTLSPAVAATSTPPTNLPSSLLNPNPVLSLSVEGTPSQAHVDFSFNPLYSQQFAVIDERGRWQIWNIEKKHDKGSSRVLTPGIVGSLADDKKEQTELFVDGWHKIMWACDVDTIVVCSRRRLAVFNVRSTSERLASPDLFPEKSSDWILDAVRSPASRDQLFVLTGTRVYWVQIIPAGNRDEAMRVIDSYRHFRDASDDSMRLTAVNGRVSVLISSSKSPLVNVFSFHALSASLLSYQASQVLHTDEDTISFRSLWLLPCVYEPDSRKSDSEVDIGFYQLWALSPNLGVSTALYTIQTLGGQKPIAIQAPSKRTMHSRRKGPRIAEEDDGFIVHEDSPPTAAVERTELGRHISYSAVIDDDAQRTVNWSSIFKRAFAVDSPDAVKDSRNMLDIIEKVNDSIQMALEDDTLPMNTLANIAGLSTSSGELEEATVALRDFIASLNVDHEDPHQTMKLTLSHLTSCPGFKDLITINQHGVNLAKIHEQLVKYWITSIPENAPDLARLAKYKIIRQLGVELCLSSLGISLQNKSSSATNVPAAPPDEEQELPQIETPYGTVTREGSPVMFSSQPHLALSQDIFSSLRTPSRTPSLYSHATSAASELKEDPAISRLIQYAVSIRALPDAGKSSLLSHWPAQPGVDPATYSYDAAQKKAAAEDGNESEHRNRKEETRRKRRMARFLKEERTKTATLRAETGPGSMSQPMVVIPSRSQPGTQPEAYDHGMSSQAADDLPMTQPDRGMFGSRAAPKRKKQKKVRKAGF